MNRHEKVYVITGGAGGMGIAIARQFTDGILLLADVSRDRLSLVKKDFENQGCTIETLVCDVTQEDQVQNLAEKAKSLGKLGAIIHTAGLSPSLASADDIMRVNAVGTALVMDAFCEIAEAGSVALVMASNAGHTVIEDPGLDEIMDNALDEHFMEKIHEIIIDNTAYAYILSKRANIRLVARQAPKWGQKNARIVSISPGVILTPMGKKETEDEDLNQALIEMNPLRRHGTPDEIALPVAFLCSSAASYINGTDLLIDGGFTSYTKNS